MTATTTAAEAASLVGDTGGGTSAAKGSEIYDFVRKHQCESCLELGFGSGVGSAYIAAALEANGRGHLTSVDMPFIESNATQGKEMLERGGLSSRVELVLEEGGYNWFLLRTLKQQLRDGRIEPVYDFVYLDGAHTWPDDALAFGAVERLLKPGGWVLLDDLQWVPTGYDEFPAHQQTFSHVQDIWDLLVVANPAFDEMRTEGVIAWARKSPSPENATRIVYKQDLAGSALLLGRNVRSRVAALRAKQ